MSFYLSTIFNLFQSIYKLGYSITLNGVEIYIYFACPPSALIVNFQMVTLNEYERFRAADAEKIRQMGVKIKDLQAAAKHQLEVAAPINAVIRDTVFIRDTVPIVQ